MTLSENTHNATEPMSPAPRAWRPLIARLHFYAGVLVAPFILVAAVTGGLYALSPTIERFVHADELHVEPSGTPLPIHDQVAAAAAAFPGLTVTGLRPAANGTDSTRVYISDPALDDEHRRAVFVDPYTGRVLGDEVTWFGYLPLSTWLDGLHRHLNLGEPGRIYSEIAASWLWVVALGGLYLWVARAARQRVRTGRVRLLTVDRRAAGRSRTLNWHGATGVWLLAALLFLSATGITWSTYAGAHVTELRSALNWERPQLDSALPTAGTEIPDSAIDHDAVVRAAQWAGVHFPVEITLPSAPGEGVAVTEIDKPYRLTTNAATVDPADLTVTSTVDYWRDYSLMAKLADWGIRAHMGFLFGLLNQLLLFGVAVGLVAVIVHGYRMWWQRRPTRGTDWAVGRPPSRGAMRRLHPAGIALLAAGTLAVGWFLPLLGIPLAGFLVADIAIGMMRRRR